MKEVNIITPDTVRRGPKPKKPLPKKEKPAGDTYVCFMCGTEYRTHVGTFTRNYGSPLWKSNEHYLPVCKSCFDRMYQDYVALIRNEVLAIRRMCMKFDYYYSPILAEKAKIDREKGFEKGNDRSLIFYYLDILNRQDSNRKKNYENTLSEEDIAKKSILSSGEMERASKLLEDVEQDEDRNLTDELYYNWGPGFEPDEYLVLQEEFDDWVSRYIVDSKAREELVREACKTSLLMSRALREGNVDQYTKLSDLWKKTMDAAELSPRAERIAAKETEIPMSMMIARFENERPIPEPLPEWKDVDGIMRWITIYCVGHLCKMVGIKNRFSKMYEDEMDKYRAKNPELKDSDDEEVLEFVLGNSEVDGDRQ